MLLKLPDEGKGRRMIGSNHQNRRMLEILAPVAVEGLERSPYLLSKDGNPTGRNRLPMSIGSMKVACENSILCQIFCGCSSTNGLPGQAEV